MTLAVTQLYELLVSIGIDPARQQVTLMRHTSGEVPVHRYVGTQDLTLYQARQDFEHPVGSLMIGFYGHRPGHALLLGVWRVQEVLPSHQAVAKGLPLSKIKQDEARAGKWYHVLEEQYALADLRLQLEIQWGGAAISWRRVLTHRNSYPVGISQTPPVPFTGLENVSLVMAELRLALQNVTWQQNLSNICGVYLIIDEVTGQQYVGSASGSDGVLQRWRDYVSTGHGGNQALDALLSSKPGRHNDFRFTLLEPLPLGVHPKLAVAREDYWKIALGTRNFGLNRNGPTQGKPSVGSAAPPVLSH